MALPLNYHNGLCSPLIWLNSSSAVGVDRLEGCSYFLVTPCK